MNKLKWQALGRARATRSPHYVLTVEGTQKVVDSLNVLFDPDWVRAGKIILEFIAFPFSDVDKLIEWNVL